MMLQVGDVIANNGGRGQTKRVVVEVLEDGALVANLKRTTAYKLPESALRRFWGKVRA